MMGSLARWGLLTTVVVTAATLVGTAIAGYLSAVDACDAVVRARAIDLLVSVRRAFVQPRVSPVEAAQELIDELADQGLSFVAVASRKGRILATAGKPGGPQPENPLRGIDRWPPAVLPAGDGLHYRVASRLGAQGPGRHRRPAELADGPAIERPFLVVFEFEPQITSRMVARARGTLAAASVAAVLLVLAGFVFWRMSLRQEAIEAQLARDRQLRLLGEMSAVLGHELRNPLTALKGHAQLLEERLPEGPTRSGASIIVREAIRLEQLAEHVLAFARTGAVDRAPEDPVAVVRAAADSVGDERVRVEAPAGLPAWPLDRVRMEQALSNLIRNAVQASPEGTAVEVTVAVNGDRLRIDVRDRGEGIPPGEESRLFEPFHTTRTRGTGLGLTVARRVVEGHGGRIEAMNHPQGGALFRLEIPGGSRTV